MDMCSKCYRERVADDERAAANGKAAAAALKSSGMDIGKPDSPVLLPPRPAPEVAPTPEDPPAEATPAVEELSQEAAAVSSTSASEEDNTRPVQKNPGRCFACNKRVGLTGFKCRCDYVFCGAHRYCPFARGMHLPACRCGVFPHSGFLF
jgi:hypothetical protein